MHWGWTCYQSSVPASPCLTWTGHSPVHKPCPYGLSYGCPIHLYNTMIIYIHVGNSISTRCFRGCAGRLMVRRPKNDVRHLKPLLHVPPTSPVSLRQVEKQKLSLINVSKVDLLTALLHKRTTHCMSVPDKQVSYIIRGNNEKYAAQWQTRTVVWGEAHIHLPSTDQLESDWTPPNHLNLQIWQIEKSLMNDTINQMPKSFEDSFFCQCS